MEKEIDRPIEGLGIHNLYMDTDIEIGIDEEGSTMLYRIEGKILERTRQTVLKQESIDRSRIGHE